MDLTDPQWDAVRRLPRQSSEQLLRPLSREWSRRDQGGSVRPLFAHHLWERHRRRRRRRRGTEPALCFSQHAQEYPL